MTISQLSAADWPTVSALLDEALALPQEERDTFVQSLDGERAQYRETLRALLSNAGGVETDEFLATLPRLTRVAERGPLTELAAGDSIGPYRLISELGTGGMGAVWLAERADGTLKRKVALKLPRLVWAKGLAERMARERDILASLEHPNIARLYDAGVDQHGRPYLALEYVEGQPIDVYAKHRGLSVRQKLDLLLQVCGAVAFAHGRLVVHRDLKPSNILVTQDGQVRLLDFGIAKLMEGDRAAETQLTQLAGRALTLDYASPEQIKGEPIGTASDVYSLGVVAYELLTGSRPYQLKRGSAAELEEAIATADPAQASDVVADKATKKQLSGDLDAILNKALKKDPGRRYATVDAFAQDIRCLLAGVAVHAQPDTAWYRARKFVGRNRSAATAAAVVALILVGATAVSLHQADVARREAARAEEVKRFALSIFENADTAAGGSRGTTALDLLRAARERIGRTPVADPAITVELLNSVAYSLIGLGEREQALSASEEALRLAQARLGAQHPLTHAAQLVLGEILLQFDEVDRARLALDAAEAGMRATGDVAGQVHALRWRSQADLGAGRFESAIAVAREAVELAESRLPEADKRTRMLAHAALASALGQVSQPGRLAPARRAYELAREIHGDRPTAEVVRARAVYASTLIGEGDPDAGLLELKKTITQQVELLGGDHVEVKHSFNELGKAALARGDPATAVESFRETLRIALATPNAREEHALQRMNLGAALAAARRLPEAEAELRGALNAFGALGMADHLYMRLARMHLANVLTRTDRLVEAEALLQPLIANAALTPFEAATLRIRAGDLYSRQGRHDEALAMLRLAVASTAQQTSLAAQARASAALGAAQLAAGNHADARENLQSALLLYRKIQVEGSPDQADLLVDVARNELAMRRITSALEAASVAVKYWERIDTGSRGLGLARIAHVRALAASGDTAGAQRELDRARRILASTGLRADTLLLAETERSLSSTR